MAGPTAQGDSGRAYHSSGRGQRCMCTMAVMAGAGHLEQTRKVRRVVEAWRVVVVWRVVFL